MMPPSAPVSISRPVAPPAAARTGKPTRASLCPVRGLADEGVTFQFNPKGIKITHGAALRELGVKEAGTSDAGLKPTDPSSMVSSLTSQQELEKQGKTSVSLDNIIFDGAISVQANCGRLLNWSYPLTRSSVQPGTLKEQTTIYLQELTFSWGGFMLGEEAPSTMSVIITNCTVNYERFTPTGIASRASVSLSLQPLAPNPTQQNPTSGGLAGRRVRTIISGETLPGIALAEYGKPGEWRTLARANQLDDPLRVRPGSVLYLPGRGEPVGWGEA